MKKVHAMAALLLAAALTFGSLSIVFADDTAAATDATVTQAKVYADLDVTAMNYYNLRYAFLGTYPQIKGYDDLNAEIQNNVDAAFALATDRSFTDSDNIFSVSYTVTENGQFAQIDVTYNYQLTAGSMDPYSATDTYYVDKELGTEITADAYTAGIAAAAPATPAATDDTAVTPAPSDETVTATPDNTNEIVMVPVRQYAEGLGYTVSWDGSTNSVILTKDSARFTITVGVNQYLVNNQMVPLENPPTNQNGTIYVPVSFFTEVLGATYTVDVNGNIVIQ
jgi:hypothetical protein